MVFSYEDGSSHSGFTFFTSMESQRGFVISTELAMDWVWTIQSRKPVLAWSPLALDKGNLFVPKRQGKFAFNALPSIHCRLKSMQSPAVLELCSPPAAKMPKVQSPF